MGKGISTNIASEILNTEPTALLDLFALYYNYQNDSQAVIYFHGGTNGISNPIIFDGQEYLSIPVESEGFEVLGDQKLPRPKIRISNAGLYVSSLLRKYNNLNGAKIIRRRTFVKFLDDVNFPNNKNPWGSADPTSKLMDEKFFISRKIIENKIAVEFELASSLELENVNIPAREVSSRYCNWIYRGYGCRYGYRSSSLTDGFDRPVANIRDALFVVPDPSVAGTFKLNPDVFPIAKASKGNIHSGSAGDGILVNSGRWETGLPYNVGDYVFTVSDRVRNAQGFTANYFQNHPVYYVCKSGHSNSSDATKPEKRDDLWVKDECSKKLGACKLRYDNSEYEGEDQVNTSQSLPFGGFPGTDNFGY